MPRATEFSKLFVAKIVYMDCMEVGLQVLLMPKKINGAHGLWVELSTAKTDVVANHEKHKLHERRPRHLHSVTRCLQNYGPFKTNIYIYKLKKHAFLYWFTRFVFTMSFLSLKSPMIEEIAINKHFMGGNLWGLSIWVVMILLVVQKSRTTTWVVSQTL